MDFLLFCYLAICLLAVSRACGFIFFHVKTASRLTPNEIVDRYTTYKPPSCRLMAGKLARVITDNRVTELMNSFPDNIGLSEMLTPEFAEQLNTKPVYNWIPFVRRLAAGLNVSETVATALLRECLYEMFVDDFARLVYVDSSGHDIPWFNISGCPSSTDIDVAFVVTNSQLPIYPPDMFIVVNTLYVCGYDVTRGLDINFVSRVNGSYQTTSGDETCHILHHTYECHTQFCPPIIGTEDAHMLSEINIFDKIRAFRNFVLKDMEGMIGRDEYIRPRQNGTSFRDIKTSGFHAGFACYELVRDVLPLFPRDPSSDRWNPSFWKTFALKMAQIILLDRDAYCPDVYQKAGLTRVFAQFYPQWETDIEQLLFRRTTTVADFPHGLVDFMTGEFYRLAYHYYPKIVSDGFALAIDPLLHTEEPLQRDFVVNPEMKPSQEFVRLWSEQFGDDVMQRFQNKFPKPNIGIPELLEHFPSLEGRVLDLIQGSPEWVTAYHTYRCGRNSGHRVIPDDATLEEFLQIQYNLIMGTFGEAIVQSWIISNATCNQFRGIPSPTRFEQFMSREYIPVTVGMILSADSRGSCPDMLLIQSVHGCHPKMVVPVEIKTLNEEPRDCTAVRREYELALKQLKQCAELLNEGADLICTQGLMIFLFCHSGNFEMRLLVIDF
jgi:hypothetical protein